MEADRVAQAAPQPVNGGPPQAVHVCPPLHVSSTVSLPRRIDLPSGDTLVVRPVEADDAPLLQALYDGLDDEDRYHRFFTLYHPDRWFFERLVTLDQRGGACVVAELVDDAEGTDHRRRIVAEASYELLEGGTGDMAITVAADWRGWIGPYLLGVLCAVAADHGIENLEASILTINRPMRSLTRARGEVLLPGSDWGEVRVAFPTSGPTPVWTTTDRPRVLLEMRGSPWTHLADLASSGYEVVACGGPASRRSPCPLLAGGECPLAAGADAIVIVLPRQDEVDELVRAHAARHGSVPVEVIDRRKRRLSTKTVADAVSRALDEEDDR
jgi:hypothetical protein